MTPTQKLLLARNFGHACGYCGTTETEFGAMPTVDHFRPISRNGVDTDENWIYACVACNNFKYNYWPQTDDDFALLRPLQDDFSLHWRENESGNLEPLTERGRFHIEKLHLNRPQLVEKRLERRLMNIERERMQRLEREYAALERRVIELIQEIFGESI